MPLTREAADAFGVVTICLVALLILLGLLSAVYSCYFRFRSHSRGFIQLSYFSGPWIIRITFILFVIWWGFGEISRLSFLRREGQLLNALDLTWQRTACKCYIVSNLGFAEPCFFVTFVLLLQAPLQRIESGILSRKWNAKMVGLVLLYCFPVFVLQLILILIGPQFREGKKLALKLPRYFTSTDISDNAASRLEGEGKIALCTYPLFSTILLGLFVTILTIYTIWCGRRILKLVINKGLQKRVYTLILPVSSLLPLRVVLLGFSVLSKPEHFLFEALSFSAFLTLLCCAGLCICMLVYLPIADSLALGNLPQNLEARRILDDQIDTISLMANRSQLEGSPRIRCGRNSDYSMKRGSISFRTLARDGPSSTGTFVELGLFSSSYDDAFQPGSPPLLGSPTPPPSHPLGSCRNNTVRML